VKWWITALFLRTGVVLKSRRIPKNFRGFEGEDNIFWNRKI